MKMSRMMQKAVNFSQKEGGRWGGEREREKKEMTNNWKQKLRAESNILIKTQMWIKTKYLNQKFLKRVKLK